MNEDTLKITLQLLSEISHELKNKLGILGTTLKDLQSGYKISKDCITDNLDVHAHILMISNLIQPGQNVLKYLEHNPNELREFNYCKVLIEFLSKIWQQDSLETRPKLDNYKIMVQIGDQKIEQTISIDSSILQSSKLNFINHPANSTEKISSLLVNLITEASGSKNILINLIDNATGTIKEAYKFPS